jgi:hypothetical protein
MTDAVYDGFLRKQQAEGLALAGESRFLDLLPLGDPADRYLAHFTCRGLVRTPTGDIVEADAFGVGIWFPDDYVRRVDPFQVLTWMGPRHVWHPNISDQQPILCVGRLVPGTGLVDLLYQCWEIITWNKATILERDALNKSACQWARNNAARLPVDTRPLKHRPLDLHIDCAASRTHVEERSR